MNGFEIQPKAESCTLLTIECVFGVLPPFATLGALSMRISYLLAAVLSVSFLACTSAADWAQFRGPTAVSLLIHHCPPIGRQTKTSSGRQRSPAMAGRSRSRRRQSLCDNGDDRQSAAARRWVVSAVAAAVREARLSAGRPRWFTVGKVSSAAHGKGDSGRVQTKARGWPNLVPGGPGAADSARRSAPPNAVYHWKVFCLDRGTGKVLWEQLAYEGKPTIGIQPSNTYASQTPVSDGQHVYAYFGMTGIFCFDLDGKPVWSKNLGSYPVAFGPGSSPALDSDRVYVQCDNDEQSFLVALDKRTGDEVWRVERAGKIKLLDAVRLEKQGAD